MCGDPLVEVDEFVDLGAGQSAAPPYEAIQPLPGGLMNHHERVDVHLVQGITRRR